jgi:ketosteroid isomerase-like protein
MKSNFLSVLIIFSVLSGNCSAQSKSNGMLEEAKKTIEESNAIYFQAFVKGDSSIFIHRYATDCCIMPQNTTAMCGKNAALDFFRIAYYQMGLRNGKLITTAIYGNGTEFVTEEGLWQLFDASGNMFDDGKYLVLWKKTKNGWKMFRDSFSSNREQNKRWLSSSLHEII